jgi:hypothetical protein
MSAGQPSPSCVILNALRALANGVLLALLCVVPLLGQERDRTLERIHVQLQQPPPVLRFDTVQSPAPITFGIFTLVPATGRGEMIRVSIPIGELVARAVTTVAAARRRHEEAVARRNVEAALQRFKRQSCS